MSTRTLTAGDVVNFGGGSTPWEVTRISTTDDVTTLRSQRSGITRSAMLEELFWHGTRDRVADSQPSEDRGYYEKPNGAVFIDGECLRGSDGFAGAVACWQIPRDESGPSMVAFSIVHDAASDEYLKLISGPGGVAYLDRRDAMRLVDGLVRMVPRMREAGGDAAD